MQEQEQQVQVRQPEGQRQELRYQQPELYEAQERLLLHVLDTVLPKPEPDPASAINILEADPPDYNQFFHLGDSEEEAELYRKQGLPAFACGNIFDLNATVYTIDKHFRELWTNGEMDVPALSRKYIWHFGNRNDSARVKRMFTDLEAYGIPVKSDPARGYRVRPDDLRRTIGYVDPTLKIPDFDPDKKIPLTIDIFEETLHDEGKQIRENVMTQGVEFDGFDDLGLSRDAVGTVLSSLLGDKFRDTGYSGTQVAKIDSYIMTMANRNRYNPVYRTLNGTPWDEKDRQEELARMLSIPEDDSLSRSLLRKWMIQSVCLAVFNGEGGEEFGPEGMLVLVGKQGNGKTSFTRMLSCGMTNLYKDGVEFSDLSADTYSKACRGWIVELGEVESTIQKVSTGAFKDLITASADEYRVAYGRTMRKYPRRTSFIGTSNRVDLLRDLTGNRRFWVIETGEMDLDKILAWTREPAEIVQAWSEVYQWILGQKKSGKTFRELFALTRDEQRELSGRNASYVAKVKGQDELEQILSYTEYEENVESYVKRYALPSQIKARYQEELQRYSAEQIGRALRAIGEDRIPHHKQHGSEVYLFPVAKGSDGTSGFYGQIPG